MKKELETAHVSHSLLQISVDTTILLIFLIGRLVLLNFG